MEYIEDYDDQCQALCKKIEMIFKKSKQSQNEKDREGHCITIQNAIRELKETLTFFKSDLLSIPRAKEQEYRQKYDAYIDKMGKYELNVKKMEYVINGDEQSLLQLKHGYDPEKYAGLNGATQALVQQGFETQDKSKQKLLSIQQRVGEIQDVANGALENLNEQNVQILRINDQFTRMEGTLARTRKHVNHFGKSFLKDKTAITMFILILLILVAICYTFFMKEKDAA